ncbi:hypothetical protein LNV09_23105 [Paucibacter sp. B2R-40]|uniref:hypothetical protein n=1 Tax=Paucibacter sp. B2R-40 TaxID=2893554 RepID=UPI0021E41A02|nr:hypothetical protein [Paucibacter sp. B2R-40]MCV2357042.1 hypothetical protein [Paucibacter sp. B2R-40]
MTVKHFSIFPASVLALAMAAAMPVLAQTSSTELVRPGSVRPATVESSWTPVRLPNGDRIALLSLSYLMAVDEDWGFGPSVYGAAKGNYGGLFTMGFTGQRRWRLSSSTHLAAGLYAGAGGGVGSDQVRFGGGLMLRPELSLRVESGSWYGGAALAHVRFPSGNVSDTSLGLVLGRASDFVSFAPSDAGKPGRTSQRTGLGFDEIALQGGFAYPRAGTRDRSGKPNTGRIGFAGADLRQYIADGSWWGVEAAGAAQGGVDGYMEVLATAGQDWPLFGPKLRLGGQLGLGLAGGGNVDTGNGWLLRAGPTLRWISPWGATVRLDGGFSYAPDGQFSTRFVRLGLALPLDQTPSISSSLEQQSGIVRTQQMFASYQYLPKVRFKDGSEDAIGQIAFVMTRELTPSLYGVAQAGSAATGKAGAYAFGLFGAGLQSPQLLGGARFGAELLAGVAGGGGVDVGSGALWQAEAYGQWEREHLRVRAGLGQWRTMRNGAQTAQIFNLSVGYAFGSLAR